MNFPLFRHLYLQNGHLGQKHIIAKVVPNATIAAIAAIVKVSIIIYSSYLNNHL